MTRREELELIDRRVSRAVKCSETIRQKWDKLRRLVAGDQTVLDDRAATILDDDRGLGGRSSFARWTTRFFQTGIERSVRNRILDQIFGLGTEAQATAPSINWEGISAMEAQLNSLYLSDLMMEGARNVWAAEMQLALCDLLTIGMEVVLVTGQGGKPCIKRLCPISQVVFDPDVDSLHRVRYAAVSQTAPRFEWEEMFGKKHFRDLDGIENGQPDVPLELIYYWDLDGDDGRFCVFRADLGPIDGVIELEPNPFIAQGSRGHRPYIPLAFNEIWRLSGSAQPISLVENMAPHQSAAAGIDRAIDQSAAVSAGFWAGTENTFTAEGLEAFNSGDRNKFVTVQEGSTGPVYMQGGGLDQSLIAQSQRAEEALSAAGGKSPYSISGTMPVKFASEVNAVQSTAGQRSAYLARIHVDCWKQVAYLGLAYGMVYDKQELTLWMDDVPLQFGLENPIGEYLRLAGTIQVEEDSMSYMPKAFRKAEAAQLFEIGLRAAAIAPNAPKEGLKEFLAAAGIKNIQPWLESDGAGQIGEAAALAGDTQQ